MTRDDIQKLLGGYATGTLTPEEQQALFEAALDDQELFDALGREQALCDLLRDPSAKSQLLAALDRQPLGWRQRLMQGWRPLVAVAAMAGVGAIAVVVWQSARPAKTILVAQVTPPPPLASPQPAPAGEPAHAAAADQAIERRAADKPVVPEPARDSLAKASPAKMPPGPEAREEDRGANVKQAANAPKPKDRVGSNTESPSVSKPTPAPLPAAPVPPRTMASGFRDTKSGDTTGALGGMLRPDQPGAAAETKTPYRGTPGGAIGGVSGGIIGGVPGAAPPPPVQAQAAPSSSQQQQQGQQGAQSSPSPAVQFGQLPVSGRAQLDLARLTPNQGVKAETVQVQAEASLLDTVSPQDARSLFYGTPADSLTVSKAGGRGGAGGGGASADARKKVAAPLEKAQAASARQAGAVNTIASNSRAGQAGPLNLGVRYDLLRKTAAGNFEHVDANGVKAGDTLELELRPNGSGSLMVEGRRGDGPWRRVMLQNVEALETYLTPLGSGETAWQVTLVRTAVVVDSAVARDGKALTDVARESTTEPATYVVAGPASQLLRFSISVNYQ